MATTIPLQPIIAVRLKVSIHSSFLDFFHHKHVSTEPALEAWKPRVIETAINDSTVDTRFIRLARIALYTEEMAMTIPLRCLLSIILPRNMHPIVTARPDVKARLATSLTVQPI